MFPSDLAGLVRARILRYIQNIPLSQYQALTGHPRSQAQWPGNHHHLGLLTLLATALIVCFAFVPPCEFVPAVGVPRSET